MIKFARPTVVSFCDRTGVMVEPWLAAGCDCWIVDIKHPAGVRRDGRLVRVGADVRVWMPPMAWYVAAFAFPPCNDQAVSGARWFKDKGLAGLARAVELVERCRDVLEWTGAPWLLENPVGTLSNYWRAPAV